MSRHDYRVSVYLQALSRLCAEVAREPRLLPLFLRLILLVPQTIAALQREARRLAA